MYWKLHVVQILVSIAIERGLLAKEAKYNHFVTVMFFLDPAPMWKRWTDFHALR